MKIVIAPDSYKDCLDAAEVCSAIEKGILKADKNAEIVKLPLADGGEGTARILTLAAGGRFVNAMVSDPLGKKIEVSFGLIENGKCAVLDMASASGLELLSMEERNPLKTSSRGTGELIKAVLDSGAETIIMGIGGSATNDGGTGMLSALGFRFYDADENLIECRGETLGKISRMDCSGADVRLKNVSIKVACDVTNPLTGENGASAVFGPQKGATESMAKFLDEGLRNLGNVWICAALTDNTDHRGDGAAGGMGAALRVCLGAKMESGAKLVMKTSGFYDALNGADLVITGEGKTDLQSSGGKLCFAVAEECKRIGVPVALFSGIIEGEMDNLTSIFDYAVSIRRGESDLGEMIKNCAENLVYAAENLIKKITLT